MEKGNPLSLGSTAGNLVDEPHAGRSAPRERCVEVADCKADVMNSRPALRDELPDRSVGLRRFEQLDERLARRERLDSRAVGIGDGNRLHAQNLTIEGKR